jgi:hypothetical protein
MAARNRALVDVWTPAHLMSGMLVGAAGVRPELALALGVAFEMGEKVAESKGFPLLGTKRPESRLNVAGDLLAYLAGYAVMKRARGASF